MPVVFLSSLVQGEEADVFHFLSSGRHDPLSLNSNMDGLAALTLISALVRTQAPVWNGTLDPPLGPPQSKTVTEAIPFGSSAIH